MSLLISNVDGSYRRKEAQNEGPERGPLTFSSSPRLPYNFSRRPFSSRKRDFYDVLGISKGADKKAVKKSYFQLAKKYVMGIMSWGG